MLREADHSRGFTLSVVPLLQERFRQLERMKELRQEKELLRMLSESERSSYSSPPTTHDDYHELLSKKFSGSELMFLPPKPHCQLSLSLWPESPIKHADSRAILEAPSNLSKSSWFADPPLVCTLPIKPDQNSGSDIDTSLRL